MNDSANGAVPREDVIESRLIANVDVLKEQGVFRCDIADCLDAIHHLFAAIFEVIDDHNFAETAHVLGLKHFYDGVGADITHASSHEQSLS